MNEVSLSEILESRENRAKHQVELLKRCKNTLICFTLNIAGPVKASPMTDKVFKEGISLIRQHLERNGCGIDLCETFYKITGEEAFFAVDRDSNDVKRLMLVIEEKEALGRIFDIDVIDQSGEKITREQLGEKSRTCFICDHAAKVCARSRCHSVDEVLNKIQVISDSYFRTKFINTVSDIALRALLFEAAVTPKPGLVDRNNNGAHSDMDYFTFISSSSVLLPFFSELTEIGINHVGSPVSLLKEIRYTGQKAESAMYKVTGGVNTQSGLIFSIGLLCSAIGHLYGKNQSYSLKEVVEYEMQMTQNLLDELWDKAPENRMTKGKRAFLEYGVTGIRGEAASGYSSVLLYGLPVLKRCIAEGLSMNDAGVVTLINLMADTNDTNLITRSDMVKQAAVKNELQRILASNITPQEIINAAKVLDDDFIKENISPGGCADLLAISFFLYFLETEIMQDNAAV
jgi:holo-ACP synthase/triphosphoribosyl-dephospho-CoA synthase